MKAIVVRSPGGPEKLSLEEFPDPSPEDHELLLDVHATALNRADLLQRRGLYPPPLGASEILGLECAGVVAQVGRNASCWVVGDRVMALLAGGGYAERVAIPEPMAIPIPQGMSFEQAACIPEAFLTAREALFGVAKLQARETVLIHAATGGVGSAAVQLAAAHGASVFATVGSPEKLSFVRELGADYGIPYHTQDFVEVIRETTGGRGVDVILDFVGAAYAEKHASCLAVGGRQVVLGLLGGNRAPLNFSRLLSQRHSIHGLVMRTRPLEDKVTMTRAFTRESLPLFRDGRLRPVIDSVWSLSDAPRAHERMEANANLGKIVLRVRS